MRTFTVCVEFVRITPSPFCVFDMKLILALSLTILACSQAREAGVRRYDGYKVFSVNALNKEQYQVLWDSFINNEGALDFWTKPVFHGRTDVMVAPEEMDGFSQLLTRNGINFTVKVDDVQELIDEERTENEQAKLRSGNKRIGWDSYARFAEIKSFIEELPSSNGAASIGVSVIGTSAEGREIHAIKISTNPNNKKAIVIDANIHAREWITSATATYIINELVTKPGEYQKILNGVDYYFIPMVNVDGYEYSHTTDRMWRKTRSINSGSTCRGCDPNRNFPYQFGGEGTSSNPCSDIYKGSSALSEKETKAVADYVTGLQRSGTEVRAYISFHSYGQLWLLPWGYTAGAYPPDYADQLSLGQAVQTKLQSMGTRYTTGTGADVLYGVGGASDDWAKSVGIKYTVTAEMRDTGRYGFVLPPSQIIPNAQEMIAALEIVAERVQNES